MFGIVIVRSIAVLCGLGALLLTAFLAWVLIDARQNDLSVHEDPHYAVSVRSMAAPARR